MTVHITIDIETLPNVANADAYNDILNELKNPYKLKSKVEEWDSITKYQLADEEYRKQALDPWTGEIVCISWAVNDGEVHGIVRDPAINNEKTFLATVDKAIYDEVKETGEAPQYAIWVGHNLQFDIGWIAKRMLKYQIRSLMSYPSNPKPLGDRYCYCTMANAAGWSGRVSLNKLAKFFGLGDKIADGGMVYDMYVAKQFDDILKYCMSDVWLTREIYYHLNYKYAVSVGVEEGNTTGAELAF
jgi:hypothetical protein